MKLYPAILESSNALSAGASSTLRIAYWTPVTVHLLKAVLGDSVSTPLSVQLQAKTGDLVKATSEVERVIERLGGDLAADKQHWKFSEVFATERQHKCTPMTWLHVTLLQCYRNNVPANNAFDYYKRALCYLLLDHTAANVLYDLICSNGHVYRPAVENCKDAGDANCATAAFHQPRLQP